MAKTKVAILCIFVILNSVHLYPESGLHVNLVREQSILANKWTVVRGWAKVDSVKGLFLEDLVIRQESKFIPSRSGIYYATLHLHFKKQVKNLRYITNTSMTIGQTSTSVISKGGSGKVVKNIQSSDMLLVNVNASFEILLHVSVDAVLTQYSSFAIQFVSSYVHALGFIANPTKQTELHGNAFKQYILDWSPKFEIINALSKSTANFIIPIGGFYIIVIKLILENTQGNVSLYLTDSYNFEDCVHQSYFHKMASSVTISFAVIRIYKVKNKVSLLILAENNCFVSKSSEYSIFFLESAPSNDYSQHAYHLGSDEYIQSSEEFKEILNWKTGPDQTFFQGAFQIFSSGYYFVGLKLIIETEGRNYIRVSILIDQDDVIQNFLDVTNEHNVISMNNILFIRQKESLVCQLQSLQNVKILKLSSFTIYKVPFQIYSSLYINKVEAIETQMTGGTYMLLKNALEKMDANANLSLDGTKLIISEDGVYYIIVNYYVEMASHSVVNMSLIVNKTSGKSHIISTCYENNLSSCFLSTVLFLEAGDALSVWQDCSEPSCSNQKHSISIELQYFKQLEESIGLSIKTKSNIVSSINHQVKNLMSSENYAVFFNRDMEVFNERIVINQSGIYLIAINLMLEFADVLELVDIIMTVQLNSTVAKPRLFHGYKEMQKTKGVSISFVKTYFMNLGDWITVRLNHLGKDISDVLIQESCSISVFLLTRDRLRDYLVEGTEYSQTSGGSIFTSSPTVGRRSVYLNFVYDFLARKTFVALLTVTLYGELTFGNKKPQYMEVYLTLKGTKSWPHLLARKTHMESTPQITLQFSGVLILQPNELIQVYINISSSLVFKTLKGTSVSFAVLEGGSEEIENSNFFESSDILFNDHFPEGVFTEKPVKEPGLYMLFTEVKDLKRKTRKRRSSLTTPTNATKDQVQHLGNKLLNIWDGTHVMLKVLRNRSVQMLLNYTCDSCTNNYMHVIFMESNDTVVSSISNKEVKLTTYQDYLSEKAHGLQSFYLHEDTVLCGATRASFISGFSYVSDYLEVVLLTANIFTNYQQSNVSIVLTIDGQLSEGETLAVSRISTQSLLHQINKRLYLKMYQTISFQFICNSLDDVYVRDSSSFTVYRQDMLIPKLNADMPVFFVQPSPRYVNTPGRRSFTCEASQGKKGISYHWNKVDLFSGNYSLNISSNNYIELSGTPQESGHYFCSAYYNGYEVDSNIATFNLKDKDECMLMLIDRNFSQPCHKYSTCTNTIGSYACFCNNGFLGDGISCTDINECDGENICGQNSTCTNLQGSFNCSCRNGYGSMNGKNCADVNECEVYSENFCNRKLSTSHAYCVNFEGSYECICEDGYKKERGTCQDVNECYQNPDDYPCHKHATCINAIGTYSCECDDGWHGNGTECYDVDECFNATSKHLCTENANCINSPGSYRCICKRGYKGDGISKCEALGCFPPSYCSGQYSTSWWTRTPYINYDKQTKQASGLIKDILSLIIQDICRNCSQLMFTKPLNGSIELEIKLEKNITDFAFPLYGSKEQLKFRGFPFIPLVEAPGVAFFVKKQKRVNSPLIQSLSGSWPILVITILLASLSGVIIWFLDTVRNPDEFPHSFLSGSWEGFWWAFITMTTVGYGDKAPRSFFARLFGIVWILIGLVIISTFTATITTVLTASSLGNVAKLYGTKIGALENSEEFRLGVKRNADVTGYDSVSDILAALEAGDIQGALLDTFIAGEFQGELESYKLQEILEHVFVYGVALSRDASRLEEHVRAYLERKQSTIYATISQVVKPLKENKASKSSASDDVTLFDSGSAFFQHMLLAGSGLLLALVLVGFTWDYLYWRRKRKLQKKELKNSSSPFSNFAWRGADIIEYQKGAFKKEVVDLKKQINCFAHAWIERLDAMETTHEQQLNRVQKWLGKSSVVKSWSEIPRLRKRVNAESESFVKLFDEAL